MLGLSIGIAGLRGSGGPTAPPADWTPSAAIGATSGSIIHWHAAEDGLNASAQPAVENDEIHLINSKGGFAGLGSPYEMNYAAYSASHAAHLEMVNGVKTMGHGGALWKYTFEDKDALNTEFWMLIEIEVVADEQIFFDRLGSANIQIRVNNQQQPGIVGSPTLWGNSNSPNSITPGWRVIRFQARSDGLLLEVDGAVNHTVSTGQANPVIVNEFGSGQYGYVRGNWCEDLTVLGTADQALADNLWAYLGAKRDILNGVTP